MVQFNSEVSLTIFCLNYVYIIQMGVLSSPTIIVFGPISLCQTGFFNKVYFILMKERQMKT
jgi:hypothetical protein